MKLLVSPAWLDASAAQGSFLVNGGGGSSSSNVPAELVAVRGIANPLDHKSVYLTDAFREQHKDNKTVNALLMSAQPILLGASTVGLSRATAEVVFCTDPEYLIHQPGSIPGLILRPDAEVYTFPTFLARMVPGHGTERAIHQPVTKCLPNRAAKHGKVAREKTAEIFDKTACRRDSPFDGGRLRCRSGPTRCAKAGSGARKCSYSCRRATSSSFSTCFCSARRHGSGWQPDCCYGHRGSSTAPCSSSSVRRRSSCWHRRHTAY